MLILPIHVESTSRLYEMEIWWSILSWTIRESSSAWHNVMVSVIYRIWFASWRAREAKWLKRRIMREIIIGIMLRSWHVLRVVSTVAVKSRLQVTVKERLHRGNGFRRWNRCIKVRRSNGRQKNESPNCTMNGLESNPRLVGNSSLRQSTDEWISPWKIHFCWVADGD